MNNLELTLQELEAAAPTISQKKAWIGLDGYVDRIISVVDKRFGPGQHFKRIEDITAFGNKVLAAAGKSAGIEAFVNKERLGGNGPLMGNAIVAAGIDLTYVGILGQPNVHPVFEEFARKAKVISIGTPAITNALEFDDGKVMLSEAAKMEQVEYHNLLEQVGKDQLIAQLSASDLIAMVNWSQAPFMTQLLGDLIVNILPQLPENPHRHFFFDIADCNRRPKEDIVIVLDVMKQFMKFGQVNFGMNLNEACQIDEVLHGAPPQLCSNPSETDLVALTARLQKALGFTTVAVHPVKTAACASADGSTAFVQGPFCEKPLTTTGAGDHFNAGFMTGKLLGLSPAACLTMGVNTSGSYVRTADSPSLPELVAFIRSQLQGA